MMELLWGLRMASLWVAPQGNHWVDLLVENWEIRSVFRLGTTLVDKKECLMVIQLVVTMETPMVD